MDGETIQRKVYYGYQQAAARVGLAHNQFRPSLNPSALPLDASNLVGSIFAGMTVATSANFNPARPATDADFKFACLADGRVLQVGDILQRAPNSDPTYFIGAMDPLMPIVAVRCNAIVSVLRRSAGSLAPGLNPYSGPVLSGYTTLLNGLPASIQFVSTGRNSHGSTLPSDAPGPLKFRILLSPLVEPENIATDDFLTDDEGRRFMVSGFEKTPIGLSLDVVHVVA
jgi:hypothetical protein